VVAEEHAQAFGGQGFSGHDGLQEERRGKAL
jgi:hypothetical protein